MSDLIRREDVMFSIINANGLMHENGYILVYKNDVLDLVRLIPTAEPKVGKWIENETTYADNVRQTCDCSVCGERSPRPLGNYCRWCGAEMKGEPMSIILNDIDISNDVDGIRLDLHFIDGRIETHILDASEVIQIKRPHGNLIDSSKVFTYDRKAEDQLKEVPVILGKE